MKTPAWPGCGIWGGEPADKPGSVVDSHSSGTMVTHRLEQPTRRLGGPLQRLPIWLCSGWGLPAGAVAGPAVRSYRTISPLPVPIPLRGLAMRFRAWPDPSSGMTFAAPAKGRTFVPPPGRAFAPPEGMDFRPPSETGLRPPRKGWTLPSCDVKVRAIGGMFLLHFPSPWAARLRDRLIAPRCYLAPCPVEPGLSSMPKHGGCLADSPIGSIGGGAGVGDRLLPWRWEGSACPVLCPA